MQNQVSSAPTNGPASDSPSLLTHPAFFSLEDLKMKQLQEVSARNL